MQSIETLNTLRRDAFVAALQPLFEIAGPLADALYAARPFGSYAALIDTAEALTRSMTVEEQAVVLSAHPPIGADPATLSAASFREQGNSAETDIDPEQLASTYAELATLNAEYERRFGFRFVVFVNGRSKAEILQVLQSRLHNSPGVELQTGVRDMFEIARARLVASARIGTTLVHEDDPARQTVLAELRRDAIETYGEDRAAEVSVQMALQAAATAIWRVTRELLEPDGNEP